MSANLKPAAPAGIAEIDAARMESHWLPFTDNLRFKQDPRLFARAEGMYYWSHKGRKILDGSSGLFAVAAGHCRPEIADAVARQLRTLDYTPSFLRSHPLSFQLADRIAGLMPDGLKHVFFVNSGSESVETAMKIALAYHYVRGKAQRNMFVSRERAYHGVNFGGVALSGMVRNREMFGPGLPGVAHMRHTWLPENRYTQGEGAQGVELADDLLRIVQNYGTERIAACFVEPIAGSTGVLVPPKGYLARLRQICDQYGILLVFDEVITGFGRTGQAFAAQSFGVTPDMITMAKAITNGAQPMGAVAVRDDIYETMMRAGSGGVEFFHGYTWSAHPAACAAAIAALDIYRDEGVFERGAALSGYFLDAMFSLADLPVVTDVRGYGMLAGFDVAADGGPGARGMELQRRLFDAGLHIKTTGDAGIVAPALVAERAHVDELVGILRDTLKKI
jgi:beta-alanine--pyruvate transaminase